MRLSGLTRKRGDDDENLGGQAETVDGISGSLVAEKSKDVCDGEGLVLDSSFVL